MGRHPAHRGERLLAGGDGRRERPAARPGALRPRLARGVAPTPRRHAPVADELAPPPAPRCPLAARVGDRGLGLHRGRDPRSRGPERLVSRQRPGRRGQRSGARARNPGPLGSRLAARRCPGTDDRRGGPHDPLVGPLAQGRAERRRRGAGPDRLRGRAGGRAAVPHGRCAGRGAWPLVGDRPLAVRPPDRAAAAAPPGRRRVPRASGRWTSARRPAAPRPTPGPAGRPWR